MSAAIGVASLVLGIVAGLQSSRAQRSVDTDVDRWVTDLARLVAVAESAQRRQLLSGQADPIDVEFVFRPASSNDAKGARPDGSLIEVVEYFRDLRPQRLVITGPPGAGKTVLAIELILRLLEERSADEPVPVRVPAASWDPDIPVEQWLTHYLTQTFQLKEVTAKALVQDHRILPVIDGLDEMDAEARPGHGSRAGRALEALNGYQRYTERARMVLTCRSEQYDALNGGNRRARDAARVNLLPVSTDKAWEFIQAVIDTDPLPRWRPVLDALTQNGHPLAAALNTPWRLTLAVTVYEQRHPETGAYLRDPQDLVEAGQIHRHLLDLFIPAATDAATRLGHNPCHYQPDQVRAWLTALAQYLNGNSNRALFAGRRLSTTDLILHELWPMAGNRPRALTSALATALSLPVAMSLALASVPFWFNGLFWLYSLAVAVFSWRACWMEPTRMDRSQIRTSTGRRRLGAWLALGVALGLGLGLAFGLRIRLTAGLAFGPAVGLVFGLVAGVRTPASAVSKTPRDPVRDDLIGWHVGSLVVGLVVGLASAAAVESNVGPLVALEVGVAVGVAVWLASGLAFGLAFGLTGGPAGMRYLAFIACAHRRLPWRLDRFLNWCYADAGLLRTAGIAYQFRHLDLQNHLAPPSEH